MGKSTGINWTDSTWNPWQGCHKVSQGCRSCYMYSDKKRYGQDATTVVRSKPATFNAPLRWEREAARTGMRKRVFTCSWSDFFIEEADLWRDEAFAIMALCPHLDFQVLTKRAERMYTYFDDLDDRAHHIGTTIGSFFGQPGLRTIGEPLINKAHGFTPDDADYEGIEGEQTLLPLPNVHLGVSCEDQATADARIPWLMKTPAAVRFVSFEPALEAVNFDVWLRCPSCGYTRSDALQHADHGHCTGRFFPEVLDWIICGGESGSQARPCNLAWVRQVVRQCQAADVACWVKQLGSRSVGSCAALVNLEAPATWDSRFHWRQKAGADLAEWPADLQVQQMPPGQEVRA